MTVAVIGSRGLRLDDLSAYLPAETTEIISGGAMGIDTSARIYARTHQLPFREYLPEYEKYGRSAPLKRNITIIKNADLVLAFWDGCSPGTAYVIRKCRELHVPCRVFLAKKQPPHGSPCEGR